jgi:hypothetical protein
VDISIPAAMKWITIDHHKQNLLGEETLNKANVDREQPSNQSVIPQFPRITHPSICCYRQAIENIVSSYIMVLLFYF